MTNNDNQFYIYLRATKEKVPVTEQEFKDYYRDIDTFRKKQQKLGKCVCPTSKRLSCDMDCNSCPFRKAGNSLSIDCTVEDEFGNEHSWLDDFTYDETHFEEIIADTIELKRIFARIQELLPEAIEIGILRQCGLSDRRIEQQTGVPRKTAIYRIERLKKVLKKEFPDFF